jgi:hypothetical protein
MGKAVLAFHDKPLIKLAVERLGKVEIKEPLKAGDNLRVSAFAEMCPRQEILCAIHNVQRKDTVDAGLEMVFAHGQGLHHVLQNRILPAMGVFYGRWSCIECGHAVGGHEPGRPLIETVVLRPKECAKCKAKKDSLLYRELYFRDAKTRIAGHPDGFLKLDTRDGLGIVEAKSISPLGVWGVKNCPNINHVIQAQIYLWLTGLKWAQILYWDKGTPGLPALVEHFVERDEETIEEVQQTAQTVWTGIENGILPERVCCVTPEAPRAKDCAVSARCFKDWKPHADA